MSVRSSGNAMRDDAPAQRNGVTYKQAELWHRGQAELVKKRGAVTQLGGVCSIRESSEVSVRM